MRAPRTVADGFVLVGVVMFVLALTILGLSLYALSSYEAVFFGQSHDSNAALYRAQGGLDMVTGILEGAARLDTLQRLQPFPASTGVVHAVAYHNGQADSTSAFSPGDTITVLVTAGQGDAVRQLSARFIAGSGGDPYKRLFTVGAGGIDVDDEGPTSVTAVGTIWVTNPSSGTWCTQPDTTWRDTISWYANPRPPFRSSPVPPLGVQGFYLSHPAATCLTPVSVLQVAGPTNVITFDQHAVGTVGVYRGPANGFSGWTFRSNNAYTTLKVKGTAVWIVPNGFRSDYTVNVQPTGTPTATLVIVASPISPPRSPVNTVGPADAGIYSLGGINVPGNDVNVILVSDGSVELRQVLQYTPALSARELSINCNRLRLLGPSFLGAHSILDYDPSMDAVITGLESVGALPAPTVVTSPRFRFLAGSWKDLTP